MLWEQERKTSQPEKRCKPDKRPKTISLGENNFGPSYMHQGGGDIMTKQFGYLYLCQRLQSLSGIFFIFILALFLCTPFTAFTKNKPTIDSDTTSTQEKQKGKQKGKQKNKKSDQTVVSETTTVSASSSAKGSTASSSKGQKRNGGHTSVSVSTATTDVSSGKRGNHEGKGSTRSIFDVSLSSEDDETSDQPPWAGKNGDHSQKPGGGNHGAETSKGDNYGDLYVMSRYDDGTLIYYTADGEVCTDGDGCYPAALLSTGDLFILVDDADPPDTVQEVDFGRLNIARAPDKVLDSALAEALSKLDGAVITAEDLSLLTDESGRLLTYDELGDLTATAIDSPRENLALYQAILEQYDSTSLAESITIHSGPYSLTIEVAAIPQLLASALAAAADKYDTVEIDEVVYISTFLGVEEQLSDLVDAYVDWYDPETFYAGTITILDTSQSSPDWISGELLSFVTMTDPIPTIDPDGDGIDIFTQAVDDSVQILEFIHDSVLQ